MHRTFWLTLTISHVWINITFDSFNILSLYLVNTVGFFFFKLNLHQHLATTNISHSWCDVFSLQPYCNNTYHLVSISSCELQEKNHMMTETRGDSLYTLFLHFRGISIFPQNPHFLIQSLCIFFLNSNSLMSDISFLRFFGIISSSKF